ncbi:acyltransferase domain-containing protein [Embleya sp. NPDC020886]|uniref:acyltransferase domain-containing protein n=1 Tax=Embleya sp. NPDC020886 TaxID=3363980 RepID=UPI0037B1F725
MADGAGAAGQVANHLGLTGPSISLSAGSPALLALHLAAQALRAGDCTFALVGAQLDDDVSALLIARESAVPPGSGPVLAIVRGSAVGHGGSPDHREQVIGAARATAGRTSDDVAAQPTTGIAGVLAAVLAERTGPAQATGVTESGADGTTVHVVLEDPTGASTRAELPWVVTAQSSQALRAKAIALAAYPDTGAGSPADVGHTLLGTPSAGRRAVVLGGDRAELQRGLAALAAGGSAPNLVRGTATTARRPVFVFPGQGSQWSGMAAELLDTSPVFRDSVDACADALAEFVDWSLLDVLREAPGAPPLRRVDVLQPTLWATMVSLAEVWRSYGVQPAAVVGHCYGEIAAAQVAGGLSLRDAARLLARRSRAWLRLVGKGTVISVGTSAEEIGRRLASWPDTVELAAVNGPRSVALSGPQDVLDELVAELTAQDVYAKRIPGVDTVGHCSQVDVLREDLLQALRPVSPVTSAIPFHSTVDGEQRDTATLDTDYWYLNTRSPVRFHQAIRSLLEAGHRAFVEVSPHPLLAMSIEDTAAELGIRDVAVLGTLRREQGGTRRVLTSVAEAFVRGVDVDWSPAFAGTRAQHVDLPKFVDFTDDAERSWADEIATRSATERMDALVDLVCGTAAEALEQGSADAIQAEVAFKDVGLGSLAAVRLRNRLNEVTGRYLPAAVAFDHPTPAALARHLYGVLFGSDAGPDVGVLAAIEQADAALAPLLAAGAATKQIEQRVEALLERLRRANRGDAGDTVADRFASAGDEEMFALIGERFGIS